MLQMDHKQKRQTEKGNSHGGAARQCGNASIPGAARSYGCHYGIIRKLNHQAEVVIPCI